MTKVCCLRGVSCSATKWGSGGVGMLGGRGEKNDGIKSREQRIKNAVPVRAWLLRRVAALRVGSLSSDPSARPVHPVMSDARARSYRRASDSPARHVRSVTSDAWAPSPNVSRLTTTAHFVPVPVPLPETSVISGTVTGTGTGLRPRHGAQRAYPIGIAPSPPARPVDSVTSDTRARSSRRAPGAAQQRRSYPAPPRPFCHSLFFILCSVVQSRFPHSPTPSFWQPCCC